MDGDGHPVLPEDLGFRVIEQAVPNLRVQPQERREIERQAAPETVLDIVVSGLVVGIIIVPGVIQVDPQPPEPETDVRGRDEPRERLAFRGLGREPLPAQRNLAPGPAEEGQADPAHSLKGPGVPPRGSRVTEFVPRRSGRDEQEALRENAVVEFEEDRRLAPVEGPAVGIVRGLRGEVPVPEFVRDPADPQRCPAGGLEEQAPFPALDGVLEELSDLACGPSGMSSNMVFGGEREPPEGQETEAGREAVGESPQALFPEIEQIFRIVGDRQDEGVADQPIAVELPREHPREVGHDGLFFGPEIDVRIAPDVMDPEGRDDLERAEAEPGRRPDAVPFVRESPVGLPGQPGGRQQQEQQ